MFADLVVFFVDIIFNSILVSVCALDFTGSRITANVLVILGFTDLYNSDIIMLFSFFIG